MAHIKKTACQSDEKGNLHLYPPKQKQKTHFGGLQGTAGETFKKRFKVPMHPNQSNTYYFTGKCLTGLT